MKAEPPRLQTCCLCCCCCCMPLLSLAETGTLHCLGTNVQLPVTSISTQLPATQNLSHLPKPKNQEPPFSLSRSLSLTFHNHTLPSSMSSLVQQCNLKTPHATQNLCCSQMLSLLEICSHFQSSKVINAPLCCCCCYRCKTKKQRQQQQLKRDFEMLGGLWNPCKLGI
jgi:hypothetical protein